YPHQRLIGRLLVMLGANVEGVEQCRLCIRIDEVVVRRAVMRVVVWIVVLLLVAVASGIHGLRRIKFGCVGFADGHRIAQGVASWGDTRSWPNREVAVHVGPPAVLAVRIPKRTSTLY